MTLIVETGTGDAAAESYASVADTDAFLYARGLTLWAEVTTSDKEAALRRATDYMVQTYRQRWAGTRVSTTQALDWPRDMVPQDDGSDAQYLANNGVPLPVKAACMLLAFKAAAGDLAPDLEPQQVQSETVGPISTTYFAGAAREIRYPSIERLLSSLMGGRTGLVLDRA